MILLRGQVRLNCESNLMTNDPALQHVYAPAVQLQSPDIFIILLGITIQQLIYYTKPDIINKYN